MSTPQHDTPDRRGTTAVAEMEPERTSAEPVDTAPPIARVRDDDLEPHAGLRYIARLFKALAILLLLMLIAEIIIGFQQQGVSALGTLLIEATRILVFAGMLWGGGDIALMLIESNHDLRAARILLGRLNSRFERQDGGDGERPPRDRPVP